MKFVTWNKKYLQWRQRKEAEAGTQQQKTTSQKANPAMVTTRQQVLAKKAVAIQTKCLHKDVAVHVSGCRVPEPVASKGGWQILPAWGAFAANTKYDAYSEPFFWGRGCFLFTFTAASPPILTPPNINSRKAGIAQRRPPQSRQQGHDCFAALLWFGLLPNCLLMLISRCFAQPTSESQQQSLIIAGNGTRTLIDNQPVYGNNNLSLKCIPRMLPQTHCLWINFQQLLTTLQQSDIDESSSSVATRNSWLFVIHF